MLVGSYQPEKPTDIRWVKIFTWRANGDGINPFNNALIEDCFIRTQDDSTYVNGRGIRRVVYWNDSNGSTFVLSPIGCVTDSNYLFLPKSLQNMFLSIKPISKIVVLYITTKLSQTRIFEHKK